MGMSCNKNGRRSDCFKILSSTPIGKRPRLRCEDNIRMDLKETDINTRNWIDSAQDRDYRRALGNAVLILWVP